MTPDRLEVNAAIGELIELQPGNWVGALKTIVAFGHALPIQGSYSLRYEETVARKIGPPEDCRTIPAPELSRGFRLGARVSWVGNYEIWKQNEGVLNVNIPAISRSDEIRPARRYLIYYEPENLTAHHVSLVAERKWFSLFGHTVYKTMALTVFGECLGEERRIGIAVRYNC